MLQALKLIRAFAQWRRGRGPSPHRWVMLTGAIAALDQAIQHLESPGDDGQQKPDPPIAE